MKTDAPITGGKICPPSEAKASMAPAVVLLKPDLIIKGMVMAPVIAALIPAIMYFAYGFFIVHLEALKYDIKAYEPGPDEPKPLQLLFKDGISFLPIILMFYLLIVARMSPMYAGMLGLYAVIVLSQGVKLIRREAGPKDIIITIGDTLAYGTRSVAQLTGFVAAIGLVQQAFVITGLGARFAQILISYFGQVDLLLLIVGMIVCIILGMGLPTPVAYILCALFVAPALEGIGINTIAAHLFLLMAAIKAGSTPPIAVVALVTANIAEADFWKTALKAFVFSIPSFLLAFAYVYRNELLMMGEPLDILIRSVLVLTGLLGFVSVFQNFLIRKLNLIERVLAAVLSMVAIFADTWIASGAWALLIMIAIMHYYRAGGVVKPVSQKEAALE